ncbi:hypothetical protein HYALB_00005561 [Hymenoscyphus albidus]|uniref:Peptidase A1 domain-containing protein n=1 Tax=Hymenoscyphus albidus TaxID=595503 RepID=A0A9N9Q4Z9_9HELO|nr:hypothetical protein HYALB_00005561 [Hymenoscyphus albidus]
MGSVRIPGERCQILSNNIRQHYCVEHFSSIGYFKCIIPFLEHLQPELSVEKVFNMTGSKSTVSVSKSLSPWILVLLCLLVTIDAQLLERKVITRDGSNFTRKFSLTQNKNPNWEPREIPVTDIYARPFRKHRIRMPKQLREGVMELAAEESNSTSLKHKRANGVKTKDNNGLYTYPVGMGEDLNQNPVQTLQILFDTGSGDFWVWSWLMPETITQGRRIYNASNSHASARWPGQSFNIPYASGSAYGLVYQDTVWADGLEFGLTGTPVECAQDVGGDRLKQLTNVDGIMGLNTWTTDSESPQPQQTWLSFSVDNLLAESVFTIALVRNGIGTIDFGVIDKSKYTGNIIWTPVVPTPGWAASGYWLFEWSGWAIGRGAYNRTTNLVLTDSGTNLTLLPLSMAKKYYAQVAGAYQLSTGFWTFPCASTLPSFTFGIGAARVTIQPKNMVFLELDDNVMCLGAIQNTEEDGFVLLGTPWLEGLFLVHDYGRKRLGFAARTN